LDDALDPRSFIIDTAESTPDIVKRVKNTKNRVMLAYSFCTTEFAGVKREIREIRKSLKNDVVIICGGPHATARPDEVLEAGADAAFIGETEESLPVFLNNCLNTERFAEKQVVEPLEIPDFEKYPPFAYKREFFGPIELRRGCASRCTFCQTSCMFPRIRERSVEYVKRYLGYVKETRKDRILFTIPDVLSYGLKGTEVNLDYLGYFLSEISGMGIDILLGNFPSEVSPKRLSMYPEAAQIFKKYIKNRKIIIGGQSASPRVLEIMQRDHDVKDIENSVKILNASGFRAIVDILLGIPGENKKDRQETLKFAEVLAEKYDIRLNMHYFMPLPGTPFEHKRPEIIENDIMDNIFKLGRHGIARGDFFKQYNFSHPRLIVKD
jgi:B12-binding domain/radical SAM domain protein